MPGLVMRVNDLLHWWHDGVSSARRRDERGVARRVYLDGPRGGTRDIALFCYLFLVIVKISAVITLS